MYLHVKLEDVKLACVPTVVNVSFCKNRIIVPINPFINKLCIPQVLKNETDACWKEFEITSLKLEELE